MQATNGMASHTTLDVARAVIGDYVGWILIALGIVTCLAVVVLWGLDQCERAWDDVGENQHEGERELASPVDVMWTGTPVKGRRERDQVS